MRAGYQRLDAGLEREAIRLNGDHRRRGGRAIQRYNLPVQSQHMDDHAVVVSVVTVVHHAGPHANFDHWAGNSLRLVADDGRAGMKACLRKADLALQRRDQVNTPLHREGEKR